MKITSILGLFLAVGLIYVAIDVRGSLYQFLNLPSLLIVLGGTIGSTLLAFNYDQIKAAFTAIGVVFFGRTAPPDTLIPVMVSMIKQARVNGLYGVELDLDESERHQFLRKAINLIEDGFDPEDAAKILKAESDAIAARYRMAERLFTVMGAFTPLFGLIGTLIGLVIMLSSVADPKDIPAAMAVALITTFYGVLFSAVFFRPIAIKIRAFNYDEIRLRDLIIETLIFIGEGINSQLAQERLESFFRTPKRA
ncbi:MotA/TolQ/ExbB proton channel family protein [bacterium]|nr:MotA/TolQ/ExbB proton channel family protein [bacterium]